MQVAQQRLDLRIGALGGTPDLIVHGMGATPQGGALGSERDEHRTVVVRTATTLDEPERRQLAKQRHERAGIECDSLAEPAGAELVVLPERQHHDVLRIREPEGREHRPIHLRHGERGGVEREAQLVVQQQL